MRSTSATTRRRQSLTLGDKSSPWRLTALPPVKRSRQRTTATHERPLRRPNMTRMVSDVLMAIARAWRRLITATRAPASRILPPGRPYRIRNMSGGTPKPARRSRLAPIKPRRPAPVKPRALRFATGKRPTARPPSGPPCGRRVKKVRSPRCLFSFFTQKSKGEHARPATRAAGD